MFYLVSDGAGCDAFIVAGEKKERLQRVERMTDGIRKMANKGMAGSSTSEHPSHNDGKPTNNAARGANEAPTPSCPSAFPPEYQNHLVLWK